MKVQQEFYEKYELRTIHPDEAEVATQIEAACFPGNDAYLSEQGK